MFTFDLMYGANTPAKKILGPSDSVPTLLDRTSALVTASSHMTRACLNIVPRDLYDVLLGHACSALLTYKPGAPGLCLTSIVRRWPDSTLKLMATLTRHRLTLSSEKKTTEMIMHIVAGVCDPDGLSRLGVLDISDIPLSGETCLAALQKIMDSPVKRVHTVVIDLSINSENYSQIKSLLKKHSNLRIHCRRLLMKSLGSDRMAKVFKLIQPDIAIGLNMDFNRLENQGLLGVVPALSRFSNIQALSLTYNLINTTRDLDIAQLTARAFSNLTSLQRLGMSQNVLTGSLRVLLEPFTKPLSCLYLCECRLSPADISYLAHSIHAKNLKELVISSNNLKLEALSLETLLCNAGDTLEYLGIDRTHLRHIESPVGAWWGRVSHKLKKLVAVTMRNNNFNSHDQIAILQTLAKNIHTLVYVGVCMVYEPVILDDDDFFDEWDESNDRVNRFFELYYEGRKEAEAKDSSKSRSLIVHDVDDVYQRDALIFIHNLESEQT
ncbi:leucine-rich repeat-containing protein 14-like [Asterias rubens]|uniref:leucine-rich repeat-containing protein 14-like n=1 Tax=Asterias rubens TaxID=7604 RepID=UPI0014551378|nr:leucine-rich repeat-containing protein 14-like [Asterias rubens]